MTRNISPRHCCSVLLLTVIAVFGIPARGEAQAFDSSGTATVEFPQNGAVIGQGIILSYGTASTNVCITGRAPSMNPGGDPPQVSTISIRNNNDASSYFQQTGVSAAAQVAFLAGGADAKASYIASHQFSNSTSTISVYATVEQRQYIAPAGISLNDTGAAPDLGASGGIELTKAALKLATQNFDKFHKECGDGFIAVLVQGAEITGTISIQDWNQADSSALQVTAHADAFGANVSATLDNLIKNTTSGHSFSLDFMQVGGSGSTSPTDADSLIAAVKALPSAAKSAPFTFHVIVRDYRTLPNWPTNVPPFQEADQLSRIMTTYWRLDALLNQAHAAQQPYQYVWTPNVWSPDVAGKPFHPVPDQSYLLGFNHQTIQTIRVLYDSMNAARLALAQQAQECYRDSTKCKDPIISPVDLYKLAVQLPLKSGQTPTTVEYFNTMASIFALINNFNNTKFQLYNGATVRFGTTGGTCYERDHSITQAFEAWGYPKNISDPLSAFSAFQASLPLRLKNEAIDYYVREPAHSRCGVSPLDPDCKLTEADFAKIGEVVVLGGTPITTNFDANNTYRYGSCTGNFARDSPHLLASFPPSPYQ